MSHMLASHRARMRVCLTLLGVGGSLVLSGMLTGGRAAVTSAITPDGTLGTTVNQSGNLYDINGGTIKGANQFHSFDLFTVGTGDIASFNGPAGIANILSRVTGLQSGLQPSIIDGTLRSTIPGANLFLMNPSGIIFGANATLDIGASVGQPGSFYATTADYIRLADGARFNAVADAVQDALLTTAPVAAFGFLTSNPGSITVEPPTDPFVNALEVGVAFDPVTGAAIPQTLALIGGDIGVNGGVLRARGGTVQLASRASPGEVLLPADGGPVEIVGSGARGAITLSGFATVDATDIFFEREGRGGTVYIRGGQLTLEDTSFITSFTLGDADGNAVGVDILVDSLTATGGSQIEAATVGGLGRGGGVNIVATDSISLSGLDGSGTLPTSILIESFGSGTSGPLTITSNAGSLEVRDGATIAIRTFGDGPADPLTVLVNQLRVLNGGTIITQTESPTGAANLFVTATDSFLLSGGGLGGIRSVSGAGQGPVGNVTVIAGSGTIEGGASIGGQINVATQAGFIDVQVPGGTLTITGRDPTSGFQSAILNVSAGDGQSGPISVTAGTLIVENGGQIRSISGAAGGVGDLTLNVGTLLVNNGSIEASTIGPGNAGTILVPNASSVTVMNNGFISTSTTSTGNAGAVTINSAALNLNNGTISSSSTSTIVNAGDAGSVTINASGSFTSDGGTVATSAENAKGGDIVISAQSVQLDNGTSITASSHTPFSADGAGNAGNITITSGSTFVMRDSSVTTEASRASGGRIGINAPELVLLINSQIRTSVAGSEADTTGGDITIDPNFVILSNSQILAQAFAGTGGNITITTGFFLADSNSLVDASSQLGISGSVDIRAPVQDLSGDIIPLSQEYLQAVALLAQRCAAHYADGQFSTFVLAGRDGLPLEPSGLLPSPAFRAGAAGVAKIERMSPVPSVTLAFADDVLLVPMERRFAVARALSEDCTR